jgi:hypothetical protein
VPPKRTGRPHQPARAIAAAITAHQHDHHVVVDLGAYQAIVDAAGATR